MEQKKPLTEQEREEMRELRLTDKGVAFLLAIENGLCPKKDGEYDCEAFSRFWDAYEAYKATKTPPDNIEFRYPKYNLWGLWIPVIVSIAAIVISCIAQ